MCLTIDKRTLFKYVRKKVVCYKILKYSVTGCYVTPYRNTLVLDDVLKGEKSFKALGDSKVLFGTKSFYIDSGYIHVFTNLEDAKAQCDPFPFGNESIFECYIPIGVKYIKGKYLNRNCYAAKEIRFVKKVI